MVSLLLGFAALAAGAAQAETLTGGNGIYAVYVNNETGQYTVTTGPSHPLGAGLNVLFGNGSPGTSFDTVRSYGSGENYELPNVPSSSTVPLGSSGFRTTYTLNNGGDNLQVVQTLRVNGTTFNDSYVEVTTVVTNNAGAPVKIGVRYLWDYQINLDDGPTFQANEPMAPCSCAKKASRRRRSTTTRWRTTTFRRNRPPSTCWGPFGARRSPRPCHRPCSRTPPGPNLTARPSNTRPPGEKCRRLAAKATTTRSSTTGGTKKATRRPSRPVALTGHRPRCS